MIPERYFPLPKPNYELKIGAGPLAGHGEIFEPDEEREQELALKRECIGFDEHYYCQGTADSMEAQEELAAFMRLHCGVAVEETPRLPILGLGNSVQEDLLLLDVKQPGLPLIAGHLCFANAWCLDEKLGLPFMAIHGPVPGFDRTIGPSSEKLLERLKANRPVSRLNWAVKATGQMDLTSRWNETVAECNGLVNADNAGERCWMRAERQTLSLLEATRTVLFTLHTYTQTVASLSQEQQEILLGVLRTCPEEMLRYKGILPFAQPLIEWLSLQGFTHTS
jgi:hypothetical protein